MNNFWGEHYLICDFEVSVGWNTNFKAVHLFVTRKLVYSGISFIFVKGQKVLLFHNLP